MDIFTVVIYGLTLLFLSYSALKDFTRTKQALQRALQSFLAILPGFLVTLVLMATVLTFLPAPVIARLIGEQSGILGVVMAALVGAVATIPGFIVFPLADSLLHAGAGQLQVALLVSTLMTVSVTTVPVEIRYFGRRATVLRNSLSFAYAFVAALAVSLVSRL